jgi:hypothetical protein
MSKTTISGILTAAASFVLFASQLNLMMFPKWAIAVAMFAQVGGLASMGITAKDYNATGGTKPMTQEAAIRVANDDAPATSVLPPSSNPTK